MRIFIPIVKGHHTIGFLLCIFLFIFNITPKATAFPGSDTKKPSHRVVIRSIRIEGNRHTQASIILRELAFHESDTIGEEVFRQMLKAAQENIFNTSLFNFVFIDTVSREPRPSDMEVVIRVVERWYVWPWPFFEISDRNFNTWVETTDLSRLSYGVDLMIQNVRGRNETLKFPVHYGFNQKLGFSYRIPYIDRRKIFGIAVGAEFIRNHEVIAETHENKTVYYKDAAHFPRQNLYAFTELLVRPTFYARHTFRVGFNDGFFSDSMQRIPGYLAGTSGHLQYFSLYYQYKNDRRDEQFYPLTGSYFDVEMDQNGLWFSAVNEFFVKTNFRAYLQIWKRLYFATGLTLKISLTPQPPYFLQRGLGYGREFVRGYEYYVIDGRDFLLWKNNLKFALVPRHVANLDFIHSQKFSKVPFALYCNVFGDAGYVLYDGDQADKSNDLRNSILIGYGAGFDFTTYYDIVIRLELAVNRKGTPGLYLHFMAPI